MELLFRLEQFEGPLDLLVFLVQKKQIDIRQLSISQLADEFLFYVRQMEELNISVTSEFIATAAYLMELKSKSLLPSLSESERREYDYKRELLIRRIEEYAKLKEIVEIVGQKSVELEEIPVRVWQSFPNVDEKKLVKIVRAALQEVEVKQKVYVVKKERYSVEKVMEEIESSYEEFDLFDLLRSSESKLELVVRFLAVLELLRFERYTLVGDYRLRKRMGKESTNERYGGA